MTTPAAPQILSTAEVQSALSRILASPEFAASRQLTSFLQFVVGESLSGRGDRLKERAVALGALDRSSSFDPRFDCIVRVVAGKVRRALEHYYATNGASDLLRIDVPKGKYCPSIRRIRDKSSMNCSQPVHGSADAAGACPTTVRPIVAVVPFLSFTGGTQERFLADLLTDDLTVRLSRLPWLEVIDCLAMRMPEARSEEPGSIASRLHADCLLAGTVGSVGSHLRFTVRLIDVSRGVLLWADQYEPEIDEGRLLQENVIVRRIVSSVSGLCDGVRLHKLTKSAPNEGDDDDMKSSSSK